jgi:flavin reductase (DIM6/NTAB) family NADH-FMN oxidoreductase RutF
MRQWTTGVCVVISQHENQVHGMTVNSFTSISLDPPIISITLAKDTRTLNMIGKSGQFSVSLLSVDQEEIADRFAGKVTDEGDRLKGLETIKLPGGLTTLKDSLGWLECQVRMQIPFENSTLLLADVKNASPYKEGSPLIYHNRGYFSI